MATPSFRSMWLLTCVAAFSTALHLNQNSIPQFHRSSRVSAHIRCCCAKALSVCLFICVTVISSEEFEACGIPTLPTLQRCFSGTLGRTKRSGWPEAGPAWGTEEWSLLRVCFQLSCQRECGYHLSARRSSKHIVHNGHLQWAQILFPATSCSPAWQVQ